MPIQLRRAMLLAALTTPAALDAHASQGSKQPLSIERMRTLDYPGSAFTTRAALAPAANYQRQVVSYQSDGLRINALLTVPNGTPPKGGWPAIVFNHGYIPPNQYRTTERYEAYIDALARAGFVVLKPDFRGHGTSEGQHTGASYWAPDYTVDALNAVSSLQQHTPVNPERVGMWGHSMGGHITLRAMVVRPDIKAGVIFAGVVAPYDLLLKELPRWGSTNGQGRDPRTEMLEKYGPPERNPHVYQSISPNFFLPDLKNRPLQLHHAVGDTHVPFSFTQSLVSGLKAAKQPYELFSYPGNDHNISQNLSAALKRSVEFFKKHL